MVRFIAVLLLVFSNADQFSLQEAIPIADYSGLRHCSATGVASYIPILKN
jgi:hypothetical protein